MDRQRQILAAALDAACRSSRDAVTHTETSQKRFPLNEQWAQSYIGIEINDLLRREHLTPSRGYVSFETRVDWIEDFFDEKRGPGPKPGALKDRQRFDIVVWTKGGGIAGLVEVKDQPVMQHYSRTADPRKLCGALRRWPKLRWGLFLFSIRSSKSKSSEAIDDELNRKYEDVLQAVRDQVRDSFDFADKCRVQGRGSTVLWGGVLFKR